MSPPLCQPQTKKKFGPLLEGGMSGKCRGCLFNGKQLRSYWERPENYRFHLENQPIRGELLVTGADLLVTALYLPWHMATVMCEVMDTLVGAR